MRKLVRPSALSACQTLGLAGRNSVKPVVQQAPAQQQQACCMMLRRFWALECHPKATADSMRRHQPLWSCCTLKRGHPQPCPALQRSHLVG